MQYLISFLEGIITFISPCLLPMLPIYISYFAGGGERTTKKTMVGVSGFILGFTVVFVAMGALASLLGSFLQTYAFWVNLVCGTIVILFGLNYMGLLKLNLFKGMSHNMDMKEMGFSSSVLFGLLFSIGWTPCVGAILGSALMLASQQGHVLEGMTMLLCYSLGLGVPFLISAAYIDNLKGAFNWIKQHYRMINLLSGGLLVIVGLLMATGYMGKFLSLMSGGTFSLGTLVIAILVMLGLIAAFSLGSYFSKRRNHRESAENPMKILKLLIIVLLLAVLILGAYVLYNRLTPMMDNQLGGQPNTSETAGAEGQNSTEPEKVPMPDFTVYDADGEKHKLSDFQGKPVILNFWATWCGYCKMEMPDFQKAYETYGDQIHFLMIDITDGQQETFEKASAYVEKEGFTFPVYYDMDWEVQRAYQVTSLPMTFFVDAEGNHVAYRRGALNADLLQTGIDLLLGGE